MNIAVNLIDTAPDGWRSTRMQDKEPSIQFYYGCQPLAAHEMPPGAQVGVVYSPNLYVHPDSPLRPWNYTVFEVQLFQFLAQRPAERSYAQISRRNLFPWEVAHFEELWLEIEIGEMTDCSKVGV